MKYFQEAMETMPAEQLRALQSEKLVQRDCHVCGIAASAA
jgi:hypothetical protein